RLHGRPRPGRDRRRAHRGAHLDAVHVRPRGVHRRRGRPPRLHAEVRDRPPLDDRRRPRRAARALHADPDRGDRLARGDLPRGPLLPDRRARRADVTLEVLRRRNRLRILATLMLSTVLYWLAVMIAAIVVGVILFVRVIGEGGDMPTDRDGLVGIG